MVTIVLLNCVFGIMLDTFAYLRGQQEKRQRLMDNFCFICCEERAEFESQLAFRVHWQHEHNLMDYCYYCFHVLNKAPGQRDGFEVHVAAALRDDKVKSWLPIGLSLRQSTQPHAEGKGDDAPAAESIAELENDRLREENTFLKDLLRQPGRSPTHLGVPALSFSPTPQAQRRRLDRPAATSPLATAPGAVRRSSNQPLETSAFF